MNVKDLSSISNDIRKDIVLMLNKAGSGHSGGAIGLADIFTVLYFDVLKHNPKKPDWKDRDFVFLSNGHVCPVLYATLANAKYFSKDELFTLRKYGSRLQGHPHFDMSDKRNNLPGIENTSGPLGQGVSMAVGLASVLKRDKKNNHVYCFVGDGEIEEGQCWESFMYASREELNNFTLIVDRNYIQIDGNTKEVMHLDPLNKKFLSFNFAVIEFDGNDIMQIKKAFHEAKKIKHKPVCLIANTVPGKGISFMENRFEWHGKVPNDDETKLALDELGGSKK